MISPTKFACFLNCGSSLLLLRSLVRLDSSSGCVLLFPWFVNWSYRCFLGETNLSGFKGLSWFDFANLIALIMCVMFDIYLMAGCMCWWQHALFRAVKHGSWGYGQQYCCKFFEFQRIFFVFISENMARHGWLCVVMSFLLFLWSDVLSGFWVVQLNLMNSSLCRLFQVSANQRKKIRRRLVTGW